MRPVHVTLTRVNPLDGSPNFTIHVHTEGRNAGYAAMIAIRRIAEIDSTTRHANDLAKANTRDEAWHKEYCHGCWRFHLTIPARLPAPAEPIEILCPFVA